MPLKALHINNTQVQDLRPLQGVPLETLDASHSRVRDIESLRGMPLAKLRLDSTEISDIAALADAPLTGWLNLSDTAVSDLSVLKGKKIPNLYLRGMRIKHLGALRGMPLTELELDGTATADLSVLKDMPLRELSLNRTRVTDLSPLAGMSLQRLCLQDTEVSDLSPLASSPLTKLLDLGNTEAGDLTPLKGKIIHKLLLSGTAVSDVTSLQGLQLTELNLSETRVSDLSPLTGSPLAKLRLDHTRVRDISPLRQASLKDWLNLSYTKVVDLSPVKGKSIRELYLQQTDVADLEALRDMTVETLNINRTPIADLSPLRGKQLKELYCYHTPITDLAPLHGMPLEVLNIDHTPIRELEPLRGMKLREVFLRGIGVAGLTVLDDMPVERLMCARNPLTALPRLAKGTLKILWASYTKLDDLSALAGQHLQMLDIRQTPVAQRLIEGSTDWPKDLEVDDLGLGIPEAVARACEDEAKPSARPWRVKAPEAEELLANLKYRLAQVPGIATDVERAEVFLETLDSSDSLLRKRLPGWQFSNLVRDAKLTWADGLLRLSADRQTAFWSHGRFDMPILARHAGDADTSLTVDYSLGGTKASVLMGLWNGDDRFLMLSAARRRVGWVGWTRSGFAEIPESHATGQRKRQVKMALKRGSSTEGPSPAKKEGFAESGQTTCRVEFHYRRSGDEPWLRIGGAETSADWPYLFVGLQNGTDSTAWVDLHIQTRRDGEEAE